MLLTEVLRERDAQVKMKNNHIDAEKSKDQHLSQLQRKVSVNNKQRLYFQHVYYFMFVNSEIGVMPLPKVIFNFL